MTLTICGGADLARVQMPVRRCVNCKRRRRFVTWDEDYYGESGTCMACGERYSGDEWLPRPFHPAWRSENKAWARRLWERALAWRKEVGHDNGER